MSVNRASPSNGSFALGARIRIAYVVYTFEMGGLERCVAHFANRLDRSRFRPMIVCLDRNGTAAQWVTAGDVPIIELHKRPGNDLQVVGRLARTLRQHRMEIVHSHNWGTLIETSVARRWARVPYHVHTEHGQGLHADLRGLKRLLRGWATRWALNCADEVVICAESVRQLIHARSGFLQSRMQFIPNGVETPDAASKCVEAREIRSRLGIPEDAFVAGSLSRLVAVKDFGTAIDAVALLRQRGRSVHLVLVGDGPQGDKLDARARAGRVTDRVHLVGRQEDVGDWLRVFDVYVNSSLSEAMSMGILEAMAVGLPVVATDVGDNASLVNGSDACGIVVPSADATRLADAIDKIATNEDKRLTLARRAQERYARQYSVECMIDNYQALYLKLFQRSSACQS